MLGTITPNSLRSAPDIDFNLYVAETMPATSSEPTVLPALVSSTGLKGESVEEIISLLIVKHGPIYLRISPGP